MNHQRWLLDAIGQHPATSPAIDSAGGTTTYRDLVDVVGSEAMELQRSLGDARAVAFVGVRGEPQTIVQLLALWTIGCVPVLLATTTPQQRIETIATRLGAPVVRGFAQVDLASCGTPAEQFAGCPDPAYIVSTSGSTGEPRLALCRWSGLELVVPQLADRYRIRGHSRVLQFASPAYDAFLADTLPVLYVGGTIVTCDDGRWTTPRRVADTIARREVTHATFPPSYLAELLRLDPPPRLDVLISAGETLHPPLARRARRSANHVINAYGPCEATICATSYQVSGTEIDVVPIGKPLRGVDVDIVDGTARIGGASVGWGYLDGPRSDGQGNFVENDDGRTFATADAVRKEPDDFVHLGRVDRLRKVLGQLVDLGEVEESIRMLDGVDAVAVLAHEGEICALVVADRSVEEIVRAAGQRLSGVALPRRWVLTDALPRLESDKLDLFAAHSRIEAADSPDAGLDTAIWSLWRSHVMRPDFNADFFTQGGTSLGAMGLLDDVYELTGVEVDLADFLSQPTLERLKELIGR